MNDESAPESPSNSDPAWDDVERGLFAEFVAELAEDSPYADMAEDDGLDEQGGLYQGEHELLAEVDDPSTPAGPSGEALADSVIVLNGPRAGTVITRADVGDDKARPGASAARRVGSADAALAPGEVLMLVHRPGNYFARMPHALAEVHANFSSSALHLGISTGLPRWGTVKVKSYLDSCVSAAVRIADPEGYALPGDLISDPALSAPQQQRVDYAAVGVAPVRNEEPSPAWNQQVVAAQRDAGANVLLTPGRSLDPTRSDDALEEAGRALDVLLDTVEGSEVPAWNLTLPGEWLSTPSLRQKLLAELVDRDEVNVWHVRVRWPLPRPPRSFGQLKTDEILTGYRELAETARGQDKALLLPNTGLTGWLTLGWGSTGFGTGSSQTNQAWAESPNIRMKKGTKRPTVYRHHVAALLHTITRDSHLELDRSQQAVRYPRCPCLACTEQDRAQKQGQAWQADVDASHTIYAMGALAAQVAAVTRQNRAAVIKQLVDDAQALYSSLPVDSLGPKEAPEHLDRWTELFA